MSTPIQWPAHFPVDCPHTEATPPSVTVYYLVKADPPSAGDFLSLREKRPDSPPFDTNELECQSCGLSVFTDLNGIELARQVSRGLRKMKTARGNLTPDLGLIKNTPSCNTGDSHHTWWCPKILQPWTVFKMIF